MNVVMVHPQHGAKIAINEIEIQQDEKNGWTRYNPDTPAEQVAAPEVERPRRGRPRRVTESIEQPNSAMLASDESEGV
jgi:hypothetical protein